MSSSSSSLSFSDSEESDVPEHLGLAPFAWDPTEKLKEANKKLEKLKLPDEKDKDSRPGSTIRFNETVAIKSSSSRSSSISEKSEKSSDSDTIENNKNNSNNDSTLRPSFENPITKYSSAIKNRDNLFTCTAANAFVYFACMCQLTLSSLSIYFFISNSAIAHRKSHCQIHTQ